MPFMLMMAGLAGLGMLVSVLAMPLRMAWATSGKGSAPGGGWWVLSLLALAGWFMAAAIAMGAFAKTETANDLAKMPVVTAEQVLTDPKYQNTPVVVQDKAFCQDEKIPDNPGALAIRTKMSGEDEVDGEETDSIQSFDYGSEQDVVQFTLGSPGSKLRVGVEELTVLPGGSPEVRQIDTGEFSPVKNANLVETEAKAIIACGADVAVTGIFYKEGEFMVLEPLPKALSILTDRPWQDLVARARTQAANERRGFWFWLMCAVLLGGAQLLGVAMSRGKGDPGAAVQLQ